MSQPYFHTEFGGSPPPSSGAQHASIVAYGPFRVADADPALRYPERAGVGRLLPQRCTDAAPNRALAPAGLHPLADAPGTYVYEN